MSTIQDFTGYTPTWCPGCGDWGIGMAIKTAFVQLGFDPSSVCTVFDIGCSSNMNDFLNTYAMHALHGRAIPTSLGIKIANHKMPVVVVGGDGGIYGEGGNHFVHACRGNHDITVIVHDNMVYGLTTGQVAPTAKKGYKSKSTPAGIIETAINPLSMALISGASFVAQGFAGDLTHLINLIKEGINHKGFSLVNVLQPCVTFNKVNTYPYYLQKVYKLDNNYNAQNYTEALVKSLESNEEKFPLGVIYQTQKPSFHEQLSQLSKGETLIEKPRNEDFGSLIEGYM